ncbi:MAG: hypothetical protein KC643_01375, partial [Nitrospira sp.]|nr:hypothetical protein [Nitrospira sp.]
KDVARANVAALQSAMTGVCHVATGCSLDLLRMIDILSQCSGRQLNVVHQAPLVGDIPCSSANIDRFQELLNSKDLTTLEEGLALLVEEVFGKSAS